MESFFTRNPEMPVIVIGSAGVDIIGRVRGELKACTSNPASIRSSFGGVARNVAENLAHLGQSVRLVSAVGQDDIGDRLLDNAQAAGINVSAVRRSAEYPTGTYLAMVNNKGEMQYGLDDMRVISTLTPEYLHQIDELFNQASLIFLDANLPKDSLRRVISIARRKELPVCADPTSQELAGKLLPYLPRLSMIVPNCWEAGILSGRQINPSSRHEAIAAAKYLVAQGVGIVIIGLAAYGVCYATSETSGHVPAIRTEVLDPTGAGDALTATVIYGLLNDVPIDDAVRLGVTAASLTLRHQGSVLPDLSPEKLYDQLVI